MELLAEYKGEGKGWLCVFRDYSTRLSCNTKIEGPNDLTAHMESQHGIPRDQVVPDPSGDVYRAMPEVNLAALKEAGAL